MTRYGRGEYALRGRQLRISDGSTACDLLYERVLPFYEALGVGIGSVLTDNGREFCGKPDSQPFELLLALEDIQHRTTEVRSQQTNGFVERVNRTLLDECFRVEGRKIWHVVSAEPARSGSVPRVLQSRAKPLGLPTQGTHSGPGAA